MSRYSKGGSTASRRTGNNTSLRSPSFASFRTHLDLTDFTDHTTTTERQVVTSSSNTSGHVLPVGILAVPEDRPPRGLQGADKGLNPFAVLARVAEEDVLARHEGLLEPLPPESAVFHHRGRRERKGIRGLLGTIGEATARPRHSPRERCRTGLHGLRCSALGSPRTPSPVKRRAGSAVRPRPLAAPGSAASIGPRAPHATREGVSPRAGRKPRKGRGDSAPGSEGRS